jgi:TPR repeat protein
MDFKSLEDITKKYKIIFNEKDNKYRNEIIDIFNGNVEKYLKNIELYNNLGNYYKHIEKNYDLMKKYYLKAIKLDNVTSMNNIGHYYHHIEQNYKLMKKYYLMAIKKGSSNAMGNLGNYYEHIEKNYDLMKKYYLMAIKLDNNIAMNNLGYYYQFIEKNYGLMKEYYLMAIKNDFNYKNMHYLLNYYSLNTLLIIIYHELGIDYINDEDKENPTLLEFIDKVDNKSQIEEQCPVCLEENVKSLPLDKCRHYLCVDCYIRLVDEKCPYCRQ